MARLLSPLSELFDAQLPKDPNGMCFKEGQRNILFPVYLSLQQHTPEQYNLMLSEEEASEEEALETENENEQNLEE